MDALPYYKWLWRDWRSNRRVQRMSPEARGLYRELLDEFWAEGSLSEDMAQLADAANCPVEMMVRFWPEIGPCFEERDGRLYNRKMDEQRTATDRARIAMAEGGSVGGKKSNSFTRAKAAEANAKGTLNQPEAMPDIAEQSRAIAEHKQEQSRAEHIAPTSFHESKPMGTIPCSGKEKVFPFTETDVGEWQGSFPGIDVMQQLRQCRQWNIDNPTKRKTAKGMRRFINSWLSRAQDASGGTGNGTVRNNTADRQQRSLAAIAKTDAHHFGTPADDAFEGMDDRLLPEPGRDGGRFPVLDGRLD